MTDIRVEGAEDVPIRSLKAHPKNARIGDVDLIAQSLAAHGQYAAVVIDQNNTILAGHHVVAAAKRLKWTRIAVERVTVTDEQGLGILLADNRATDLATNDNAMLLRLLESLPDLDGTGYGPSDIAQLDALINGGDDDKPEGEGDPGIGEPGQDEDVTIVRIGPLFRWEIPTPEFDSWAEGLFADMSRGKTIRTLKAMLGIPQPAPRGPVLPSIKVEAERTSISAVTPHPDNAREGDIGAITQMLAQWGQYRSITANRRTGHVVKGNHTLAAAKALGWDCIAVRWIDVDPDQEAKILLIDNRTSDLARYDSDRLTALFAEITSWDGTGYSPEDAAEIIAGANPRPGPHPTGQVQTKIGPWGWRTPADAYFAWAEPLDSTVIWHRLRLPEDI